MKRFYKILRALVVTLIALIFILPAALYVALSLPVVQRYVCQRAESELSEYLTVPVDVERVVIAPFNRVALFGVKIGDGKGETALAVSRLGAGVNLWEYFAHRRIVVDYAEIIGLEADLYRDSIDSPLNIQPIIDALSPKDRTKPPTKFDFRINTVVLRTSSVSYNVLSVPGKEAGFDACHVSISELRADICIPRIKNDDFTVDLRRLAFTERSGFTLRSLSGLFKVSDKLISAENVEIVTPDSKLLLNDQSFAINGFKDLKSQLRDSPFDFHLKAGSYLSTMDLIPFVPQLDGVDMTFDANIRATGRIDDINVQTVDLRSRLGAHLTANGHVRGIGTDGGISVDAPELDAEFNTSRALDAALRFTKIDNQAGRIITNLGDVRIKSSFTADSRGGDVAAEMSATGVRVATQAVYKRTNSQTGFPVNVKGEVKISEFNGSSVMSGINGPLSYLTSFDGDITFDVAAHKGLPDGKVDLAVREAIYRGQHLTDLNVAVEKNGSDCRGRISIDNPMLFADASLHAVLSPTNKSLDFSADLRDLSLDMVGVGGKFSDARMSLTADGSLSGSSIDDVAGLITVGTVCLEQNDKPDFEMRDITLESVRSDGIDSLVLKSDVIDARVEGKFHLQSVVKVGKAIVADIMPALFNGGESLSSANLRLTDNDSNNLTLRACLKTLEPLAPLMKSPIGVIHPVNITGELDSDSRSMGIRVDAPYLTQGKKLIENTSLTAGVTGRDSLSTDVGGYVMLTTTMPTKKGAATITVNSSAHENSIDSRIEWKVDRDRDFSGDLNFTTKFQRTYNHELRTDLFVNPSRLVFNDTVWTVDPAHISVEGKVVDVDGFRCWRDKQYISMSGRVSELPSDTITLTLEDVNLDYVFETLDIQTAMFGGNATGQVYATQLLTPSPVLYTPGLKVANLTYNHSLMGNALIRSRWLNDTKAVAIYADITQPNGLHSIVDGCIYPMDEALDLKFEADRLEIGFLKPYMAAFASDISGYATGSARLYGTFKLIDMVGDIYGEDVKLTLGFTNTTYTTTDSVHLAPGRINLDNLLLKDMYGNTARLNGWVTHECFKSPKFEFRISDARNLLVYDVKENTEFQWYGRVFGNGGARVEGVPGLVDIRVDMSTAPNSTFTYVLSDALSAQDYGFITFRDRDQARKDSIAAVNAPPPSVQEFNRRMAQSEQDSQPSKYKMAFNIDITPQALITLVMDPVGGDRIRCHGSGNLAMSYDSANEDLRMNGTYILDNGKYNFTLQDIIIKEFTIEPGSSIAFNGDPYAAQLNLTAKYQVKANLTDLDESFLEDKELNRTNVPVDALLHVTGDMRQPDISFSLDFPTLTEETKRKVNSIVNTDEMMSRQIIYLLALNRFYTPDYMNATRGNEFVSVASSTISSQLSNILGQLSDNWNIAPNIRSDRGDFSDVEFDVALSSSLLNNRLLFNGNLGYRDKALNNNSFIGDFDIEYLLNRSGSLRLKAYNRYNDQNYYLKSALTTQGVGIVYKRDFDNLFSFLKPWRRAKATMPSDTVPALPDSIPSAD